MKSSHHFRVTAKPGITLLGHYLWWTKPTLVQGLSTSSTECSRPASHSIRTWHQFRLDRQNGIYKAEEGWRFLPGEHQKEVDNLSFFSFLTAGKRIEVCKTALVGKHVFENVLSEAQKEEVVSFANTRLQEGAVVSSWKNKIMVDIDEKTRYLYLAYAMDELGIEHGLKSFYCIYIKNPFMIETYDDNLWEIASEMLEKKYGITVSI